MHPICKTCNKNRCLQESEKERGSRAIFLFLLRAVCHSNLAMPSSVASEWQAFKFELFFFIYIFPKIKLLKITWQKLTSCQSFLGWKHQWNIWYSMQQDSQNLQRRRKKLAEKCFNFYTSPLICNIYFIHHLQTTLLMESIQDYCGNHFYLFLPPQNIT